MSHPRLVIFDFDGTLADTNACIVSSWLETLRIMGLPAIPEKEIEATIGLPLKDSFRIGVPEERLDEAVDVYHSVFCPVAAKVVKAFDGVHDMLESIRAMGIDIAVASSRGNDSLMELCQATGLSGYFRLICGGEYAAHPKPAPDLVLHILSEMGADPKDTLVVGDAVFDIGMGNSAGCLTCGVTWGNQSREKLMTASPDHIADSIADILAII